MTASLSEVFNVKRYPTMTSSVSDESFVIRSTPITYFFLPFSMIPIKDLLIKMFICVFDQFTPSIITSHGDVIVATIALLNQIPFQILCEII